MAYLWPRSGKQANTQVLSFHAVCEADDSVAVWQFGPNLGQASLVVESWLIRTDQEAGIYIVISNSLSFCQSRLNRNARVST